MIDLPDINVWIAMSSPDHTHRTRAERYWRQESAPRVAFCAVTMLGLVRVCSNAPIFDGQRISPVDAWAAFRLWMDLSEVDYLPDPPGCRDALDRLVSSGSVSRHAWTDAYLAAFAITAGTRVVSFDDDFRRFPGLDFLHLSI